MTYRKVRPTELESFLLNPHKGIATTSSLLHGDPPRRPRAGVPFPGMEPISPEMVEASRDYLPSSVAYSRWYWEAFEPEQGRYDWSMVEEALAEARSHGQTLQVRLMPHGAGLDGALPQWYVRRYTTVPGPIRQGKPHAYAMPIYDGPEYVEHWGNAILDFGSRFDGHPWLESVDISFIGPWGEGGGECSPGAIDTITGIYRQAHPATPLIAMISGYKMTAGIRVGVGWRCDCFGDLRNWQNPDVPEGMGERWNHMYDRYPMAVCECGARDAWKTAPVVFETCSIPAAWMASGFDLGFIVQQGLKYHGSVFMPHGYALPGPWLDELARFCNDLGYRFVLRQFQSEQPAVRGQSFRYTCWIENVGVAPIYRRYSFAVRLKQAGRTHCAHSSADILQWLPGDTFLRETVQVPDSFAPGEATIEAALVDPRTNQPRVRFAVEETDAQGWVPLGALEIA